MPRGSGGSSAKRHGLQHHNSTTGLVSPKRPGRPRAGNTLPSSVPVAGASDQQPQEVTTPTTQLHPVTNGHTSANGWPAKASTEQSGDSLDDGTAVYADNVNGTMGEHRKIEINGSSRAGGDAVPATVLSSFPLLDTITLLIIFLQLPAYLSTAMHFLYAVTTFVPPSTTLLSATTPSSLPSFSNLLLQGSNGSPALLTIIFADVVVALISMFLWPPARNFLVDFAQAVIAMAFGAGLESQDGRGSKNVAVCASLLGSVKVLKGRFRFSDAWDSIQPSAREPSAPAILTERVESPNWVRNAIAIHIVAQWGMQILRRWLKKRPDLADGSSSLSSSAARDGTAKQKDKDPEAAVVPSPQPLERDNSVSGAKRKKRSQVQSIRNNQPLWATLANGIVHLTKELERIRTSSEAQRENTATAADASEALVGAHQVWITKIGWNDIGFIASIPGFSAEDGDYELPASRGVDVTGKDGSLPFFVRVNGIVWPQTAIYRSEKDAGDEERGVDAAKADEWVVEVMGLTGSTEYDFEFVAAGGAIFYMSACTLPAPASLAAHAGKPSPARPLSPVTTLLHSLEQANSTLSEKKATLKASRKTHKSGLSEIRKEIERNKSGLGNDRGEERAFRRNLALKESIKRAEEENEAMQTQLSSIESLPESIKPKWLEKKKQWQAEKQRLKAAQTKAAEEKAHADRQASAVESEVNTLLAKKEKLSARLTKLRTDLEKSSSEGVAIVDSKEQRQAQRDINRKHREDLERQFIEAITGFEARMNECASRARENWSVCYALENAAMHQAAHLGSSSSESVLVNPTTSGLFYPPGLVIQDQLPHSDLVAARERSSSVFSIVTNVSDLGNNSSSFLPAFEMPARRHGSIDQSISGLAKGSI